MSRPRYETPQDVKNQSEVLEALRPVFKYAYAKRFLDKNGTDKYARLEYWLYDKDGKVICIIEIKCRHDHVYRQHPDLMLSAHKWDFGVRTSKELGVPFFVVAKWACGTIGYADWRKCPDPPRRFGGRTKTTRDEGDKEVCVHIPIGTFDLVPGCGNYAKYVKEDVLAAIGLNTLE